MKAKEKYLTSHPIFDNQTFDQFCAKLPVFAFKKQVPEDVLKNFEVIEYLLAHSYFEYRFVDEAFKKSIETLEMAMNIRSNEITGKFERLDYSVLYPKLIKHNQFDTEEATFKYYKSIRNEQVHPKMHSFGGVFYWNMFVHIVTLINEMYEDSSLRIKRINMTKDTKVKLETLKLINCVIIQTQDKKILAYQPNLLFVDNKEAPPRYHFSFTPLFDHEPISDMNIHNPNLCSVDLKDLTFENGMMAGIDVDDNLEVIFSPIEADQEANKEFLEWYQGYKNRKEFWMYENAILFNNRAHYHQIFGEFIKK